MNSLAALWRFLGFRWSVSLIVGLLTSALLSGAGAPIGLAFVIGLAPSLWVAGHERLTLLPCWRRWFRTGRGAAGDWMSPVEMKQHTRPLPEKLP